MLVSSLLLLLPSLSLGAKIDLWTDVSLWTTKDWEDVDYSLGFLMDHYQFISIEKCTMNSAWGASTEETFQNLVPHMWELRPNSSSKILYYWASDTGFSCYESMDTLQSLPELWLYDNNGYPVIGGPHSTPFYDFRIQAAADLWVAEALNQVALTGGGSQGVFLDGLRRSDLSKCIHRTCGEDGASCCQFTLEDEEAYHEARGAATAELTRQLHLLDPSYVLIGNGIMEYDFNAGQGNPTLDFYLDKIDGYCMEHVMAFEEVNSNAVQ